MNLKKPGLLLSKHYYIVVKSRRNRISPTTGVLPNLQIKTALFPFLNKNLFSQGINTFIAGIKFKIKVLKERFQTVWNQLIFGKQ